MPYLALHLWRQENVSNIDYNFWQRLMKEFDRNCISIIVRLKMIFAFQSLEFLQTSRFHFMNLQKGSTF